MVSQSSSQEENHHSPGQRARHPPFSWPSCMIGKLLNFSLALTRPLTTAVQTFAVVQGLMEGIWDFRGGSSFD